MNVNELGQMLEAYEVPAILVSSDYRILKTNKNYRQQFGTINLDTDPKCYAISHGYDQPCDKAGEDCPLLAAKTSKQKESVLHIHQTPNGKEHVDIEMIPIFDEQENLQFFVELMRPVPLASGKADDREVIGHSKTFKKMLSKVTRVASTDASVLLLGESGTGKEMISKLIHLASERNNESMVTVECSGLSETLIESELFGHKRGSFTGAHNDKVGLVEQADQGTLFLDEIGDVSLSTQAKLLRLLETNTFRRVGETRVRKSNFRLICATHKNLWEMVERGEFRLDLYYRIGVFPIPVPNLQQRREDIPDLVDFFINKYNPKMTITESAIRLLKSNQYKGNIRELKNLITRAIILCDTNVINKEHIIEALELDEVRAAIKTKESSLQKSLKDQEKEYVEELIEKNNGDKKAAAKELGISLRTLYRKLD